MRISLRPRNVLSFLFASPAREQYLAEYVLRECARGRSLEEVLADPYVRNRSTPDERGRLLDRPEVVEAIGEQAVAEMRSALGRSATRTTAGAGT